jgi:dihydrofolate synthase/folylpolyglutamate synthase
LDPLAYLFGLGQFGVKFGLDNMRAIVARMGHPERAFRSVHIAGTNGKGSVAAMLDAVLRAAGHRSARYTSPHLIDLTERFVVDGRAVSPAALADTVALVRDAVEGLRAEGTLAAQPTFFEVTTAVAFELFRTAGVEIAVVEVGLGGRLDATNVITPEVAALTSIALDHQRHLGSTLGDIAREKAGIIKPHVPVVIGALPAEARIAVEEIARGREAETVEASLSELGSRPVGLPGAHQRSNAAVALKVLQILDRRGIRVSPDAIDTGLANVVWPGRLDRRRLPDGRELLLDAAHNPAGAEALSAYLGSLPDDKRPLVFAAMRDKDIPGMFAALLPYVSSLVATRATNPRSADPATVASQARSVAPSLSIAVEPSVGAALDAAWDMSPRIVVAGSIFLLGDVMKQLGLH